MRVPEKILEALGKTKDIKKELDKVIVGQEEAKNLIMVCLFAGGHPLLESAPGLAKSLMAEALSKILKIDFKRIQMTPDLMPQDITGYELPVWGTPDYVTRKGPIFAGLVLGDETNRAPEKTQASLMEPLQENKVTIGLETYILPAVFTFIGTRNPIETGGTFALAEAILDRFLVNIVLDYPSLEEEKKITVSTEDLAKLNLQYVCGPEEIIATRDYLRTANLIPYEHPIIDYLARLMQASRPSQTSRYLTANETEYYRSKVRLSLASPRATKAYTRASWVYSFGILGEKLILPEHVQALSKSLLRHRLLLQSEAEFDGLTPDDMINWLVDRIPVYA